MIINIEDFYRKEAIFLKLGKQSFHCKVKGVLGHISKSWNSMYVQTFESSSNLHNNKWGSKTCFYELKRGGSVFNYTF